MHGNPLFQPPYYGAAYYPEDWPLEQIDDDIALMKEAGMNVMRVGEFAWARMEPREGEYDFDWLHLVVEKLGAAGIATILGTPTCTPPAWLTTKHPEVLFQLPSGVRVGHGGRRHTCPNNPLYRDYCAKITRKMAEAFGRDDRIIGWQIDNEVAPHGDTSGFSRSCCCPVCHEKFQAFMKDRFGSIEALNDAWCLHLWSQQYDGFDQLPTHSTVVWHHPSLLAAWSEFNSRSYVDFVKAQADILHELTDHPIGTDMMPFLDVDHYAMNKNLDIVQYNYYFYHEHFRDASFWLDFMRPVQARPFWVTECGTGWSGSVATTGYSDPGFCRANSWLPIALGAEATLYWLWRTHRTGHELLHGSVVSSQGRPLHMFNEVKDIGRGFRAAAGFINGTRPEKTGVAIHLSHLSHTIMSTQPHVHGLHYATEVQNRVYQPLIRHQWRPDVIDTSVDLDGFRVLFSPMVPSLDHHGLRDRLQAWIEAGGTWVAGPFTDIRDAHGAKFTESPFGVLEAWGGIFCPFTVPGHPRDFNLRWHDLRESEGSLIYDAFEPRGAEALATYMDNELAGLAAVTRVPMGRGQVVVLGTMLREADLVALMNTLAADADVTPVARASENLLVVPRSGEAGRGAVLVETHNESAMCTLPEKGVNLLNGEKVDGTLELPPYGVAVIQYGV